MDLNRTPNGTLSNIAQNLFMLRPFLDTLVSICEQFLTRLSNRRGHRRDLLISINHVTDQREHSEGPSNHSPMIPIIAYVYVLFVNARLWRMGANPERSPSIIADHSFIVEGRI